MAPLMALIAVEHAAPLPLSVNELAFFNSSNPGAGGVRGAHVEREARTSNVMVTPEPATKNSSSSVRMMRPPCDLTFWSSRGVHGSTNVTLKT